MKLLFYQLSHCSTNLLLMLRSEHGKVSSEILGSLVGSRGFFRFLDFLGEVGDGNSKVVGNLKQFGGLWGVTSFPTGNSTARNSNFLCYSVRRFFHFIAKCYIFIPKHRVHPPRFVHTAIFEIHENLILTYEIIEIIIQP